MGLLGFAQPSQNNPNVIFDVNNDATVSRFSMSEEKHTVLIPLLRADSFASEKRQLQVQGNYPELRGLGHSVHSILTGSTTSESPRGNVSDCTDFHLTQPSDNCLQRFVRGIIGECKQTFCLFGILLSCAFSLDGPGMRAAFLGVISNGGPVAAAIWGSIKFSLGVATIFGGHTLVGGLMVAYGTSALLMGVLWTLRPLAWATQHFDPVAEPLSDA